MAKIFYDCEFIDDGRLIIPISIGMVSGDDRELYREFEIEDFSVFTPWLWDNVYPTLTLKQTPTWQIRQDILDFVGPVPELWAWYGAYDHVLLAQIFGAMIDLPANIPMFTMDIRQYMAHVHFDPARKPKQEGNAHNALDDAKWNKTCYEAVRFYETHGAYQNG